MKIEEAKTKAMFFSQYVWQIVYFPESHKFDNPLMLAPQDLDYRVLTFGGHLILRSVQDLTDEECKEMCQVFSNFSGYTTFIIDAEIDQEEGTFTFWYHENDDRRCSYVEFEHLPQPCTDYLKLKGYLLEFTYLSDDNKPVTISPAALISMGWARVK